jgi:hypothetical protein
MTTISQLTAATSLSTGDQLPIYSTEGGDTLRASLALLLAFMQTNLTMPTGDLVQQFAAPSATGFTVAIAIGDTWLILTPVAGYAAGTITLPANPLDGERVRVNSTQAVTTLTVGGNGRTVTGAPTTLAANAFFTMAYSATLNAWYRVG